MSEEERYQFELVDPNELLANWDIESVSTEDNEYTAFWNSNSTSSDQGDVHQLKLMKNDIRRHLPKMFLTAWNSGDVREAQNMFNTFITEDCYFEANIRLPSEFQMPLSIVTTGPLQFSHFMLGCVVMHPDMVLSMQQNVISGVPKSPTCTITMNVELKMTKLAHISPQLWLPRSDLIHKLYRASSASDLNRILQNEQASGEASVTSAMTIQREDDKADHSADQPAPPQSHPPPAPAQSPLPSPTAASAQVTIVSSSNQEQGTSLLIQGQEGQLGQVAPSSPTIRQGVPQAPSMLQPLQAPPPRRSHGPLRSQGSQGSYTRQIQSMQQAQQARALLGLSGPVQRVPERFMRQLAQTADPLPVPLPADLRGKLIFQLNEQNHIQQMQLDLSSVYL